MTCGGVSTGYACRLLCAGHSKTSLIQEGHVSPVRSIEEVGT